MATGKLFAVIALLCLSALSFCAYTPLSEVNALKDLYYFTNGADWKDHTNWLLGDPCQNKWYGIACVEDQGLYHIDGIFLSGNNLSSQKGLPNSIGALQFLTGLDLGHNSLSGTLPSGFRDLKRLSGLSLRENSFTGNLTNLPPSKELRWVHLDFNSFSGCFDCHKDLFDSMRDMVVLGLTDNKLTGSIPMFIGEKWKSIKTLLLGGNQLSGQIPMSLFFTKIEQLDLSRNQFTTIIDDTTANRTVGKLEFSPAMIELNLFSNPLEAYFGNQDRGRIVVFDAHNTKLYGNFPNLFFPQPNFPFLRYLKLGNTQLSGFLQRSVLLRNDIPVIEIGNIPLMCPLQNWVETQFIPPRKATIGDVSCQYVSISEITPDHGSKLGGFPINLSGTNLPRVNDGELFVEFRYKTNIRLAPIQNVNPKYLSVQVPSFVEFAENPIQVGVTLLYRRRDDAQYIKISRETLQIVLSNQGTSDPQNIAAKPTKKAANIVENTQKPKISSKPARIAEKLRHKNSNAVEVKIFGEEKCPDFGSIVTIFEPIMHSGLKNIIDLEIGYIATYSEEYATNFWSLHGQGEVIGDKFGICALNHLRYPMPEVLTFLTCLNKNISIIPLNVADCAEKSGFDMKSLEECVYGPVGTELLKTSTEHANIMGAVWSPTIFYNGKLYCLWDSMPCQAEKPSDFVRDICALYQGPKPSECENPEAVFGKLNFNFKNKFRRT